MDDRTLKPCELLDAKTVLPFSARQTKVAVSEAASEMLNINGWKLIGVLEDREYCTIYNATNESLEKRVVKVHKSISHITPAMKKVSKIRDECLIPVLEHGLHKSQYYEVLPYLSEGALDAQVLREDVVLKIVVPQLAHALNVLHCNRLLHNDVKPSNLLWREKNKAIVLSDFDCIAPIGVNLDADQGGTCEYMAPEVLSAGFSEASTASDFCSMGLTLLSLLTGSSPLHGLTNKQIRRAWMRGISVPENLTSHCKILLNGLLQNNPADRLNYEGIRRWMRTYGINSELELNLEIPVSSNKIAIQPLWFGENPIIDIDDLVQQVGTQWKLGCFMLEQKKISSFLRQFDLQKYELCLQCEKCFDKNEGLFTLLHTLSPTIDFYWLGDYYENLETFVSQTVDTDANESLSKCARFLRGNLLTVYYENIHESKDKIDRAKELTHIAQNRPELAMWELLSSLSSVPELRWKNQIFMTISELAEWLIASNEDLDSLIEELYNSKRFEAWLVFINEGKFLYEVQNEMKGILI